MKCVVFAQCHPVYLGSSLGGGNRCSYFTHKLVHYHQSQYEYENVHYTFMIRILRCLILKMTCNQKYLDYHILILSSFLVADLHKVFSDPENLLSSLINIMVNIDPMQLPTIDIEPRLGGRLWRACIKFTWPVAFRVMGESTEQTRARHYAYLEACKMFQVKKKIICCFLEIFASICLSIYLMRLTFIIINYFSSNCEAAMVLPLS